MEELVALGFVDRRGQCEQQVHLFVVRLSGIDMGILERGRAIARSVAGSRSEAPKWSNYYL